VKDPTTPRGKTLAVWAIPISLAATDGIDFSFFSSRYLDVSVPWVGCIYLCIQYIPVRVSRDHDSFVNSPELFADFHALQSLLTPRHPPCALSNLTTEISNSLSPAFANLRAPRFRFIWKLSLSTPASDFRRLLADFVLSARFRLNHLFHSQNCKFPRLSTIVVSYDLLSDVIRLRCLLPINRIVKDQVSLFAGGRILRLASFRVNRCFRFFSKPSVAVTLLSSVPFPGRCQARCRARDESSGFSLGRQGPFLRFCDLFRKPRKTLEIRAKWSWTDLNRRPSACKADALPTELQPRRFACPWVLPGRQVFPAGRLTYRRFAPSATPVLQVVHQQLGVQREPSSYRPWHAPG
jgi:hypothetical protein